MAVTNNYSQIRLYQEALSCLEIIARTLQQDISNTNDIKMLYEKCSNVINNLRQNNGNNPHISSSLESLLSTLSLQQSLLQHDVGLNSASSLYSNKTSINNSDTDKLNERHSLVQGMLIPPQESTVSLDDVIGLEDVKQIINEAFIMPTQYPHLFTGAVKPWKRLLMYGPPGTGKTKLAMAVAAQLHCPFYCVTMANLLSSWIGESEKILQELFNCARQHNQKVVIFFDEIDSLCRTRSTSENEHTRRLKTELLRQIEGGISDDIFILATTNCPWDLDTAFLRRFQQRVYIPLPNRQSRSKLLQKCFDDGSLTFCRNDWDALLDLTEGFSGADVTHLAMAAAYLPIRELQFSHFWKFVNNDKITPCSSDTLGAMQCTFSSISASRVLPRPVNINDFIKAAKSSHSTVSEELLQKYNQFQ